MTPSARSGLNNATLSTERAPVAATLSFFTLHSIWSWSRHARSTLGWIRVMGICLSTADACIKTADDAVNDFLDRQSSFYKESKQAKEHLEKKGSNAGGSSVNAVLQSHLSPVYPSLPKNAVQYHCKSVYDGDTLTLEDGKKVRLLGIDTPEIKEKQPFALEAKEYTKKYCHGKDIWLTFEQPGGAEDDKNKDHYGRILAFVWVPAGDTVNSDAGGGGKRSRQNSNSSQWICVNEGLVASGLAHSYSPSKTKKVHNHDKLLGLQKYAREKKLGQWRGYSDYDAIVTPSGSAFHKCKGKKSTESDCKYLARSKSLSLISASEAYDKGLHPCRNCFG